MRIAQVSTLVTPVRNCHAGSVESLVWLLSRELTALGHEVTVFATAESDVPCELVATLPGPYGQDGSPDDYQLCEWINLARAVEQSARFDVIHTHAYLWGLPIESLSGAAMIHSLHVMPGTDMERLRLLYPAARVTAISHSQWAAYPGLPACPVVGCGIDAASFTFRAQPDDYLLFMGRFIPDKGALTAIQMARRLGLPLRLAGPRNDYYREIIEPHVDGQQVRYEGWVAGADRDALLGGARALLYPLAWPEPFGLVQVEAMHCGTPVAAFAIGASPEIVDAGVTGYCAEPATSFEAVVLQCLLLDRAAVRDRAVSRFSAQQMTRGYLEHYRQARERAGPTPVRRGAGR